MNESWLAVSENSPQAHEESCHANVEDQEHEIVEGEDDPEDCCDGKKGNKERVGNDKGSVPRVVEDVWKKDY